MSVTIKELAERYGKSEDETVVDLLNSHDTVKEVAYHIGVSRRTVHKWIAKYELESSYHLPQTKNPSKSA